MDNLEKNMYESDNTDVDEINCGVDNGINEDTEYTSTDCEKITDNEEKPASVRLERLYGITKGITGFLLQILSIFITSCASILTFFSCGVAGYGIAAALVPELQELNGLLSTAIYNVLFFGIIICTVVLLIVAIVPASLGLVASIASIKAFFRKMKQKRPKPFITFFLGIISFLIGIVKLCSIAVLHSRLQSLHSVLPDMRELPAKPFPDNRTQITYCRLC